MTPIQRLVQILLILLTICYTLFWLAISNGASIEGYTMISIAILVLGVGSGIYMTYLAIWKLMLSNNENLIKAREHKKKLRKQSYKKLENRTSWRLAKVAYFVLGAVWVLSAFATGGYEENDGAGDAFTRLVVVFLGYPLFRRLAAYIQFGRTDT